MERNERPQGETGLPNPDTLEPRRERHGPELEPDFTDSRLDTDSIDVTEVSDDVYFPPTDSPVAATTGDAPRTIEGGFEPSSTSSIEVDQSTMGGTPDEAVADAIRRELRQDAATAGLRVEVEVEAGVAYLRGLVEDLDDVTNAEEVAARVPGVSEVVEELELG